MMIDHDMIAVRKKALFEFSSLDFLKSLNLDFNCIVFSRPNGITCGDYEHLSQLKYL